MNEPETRIDCTLRCVECGNEYLFSVGEQLYFQSKQLSIPKRCPPCRLKRKRSLVPVDNDEFETLLPSKHQSRGGK